MRRRELVVVLGVVAVLVVGGSGVVAGADTGQAVADDEGATESAQATVACDQTFEGVFLGPNAELADMITIEYTVYNAETNAAVLSGSTSDGTAAIEGSFQEGTTYELQGEVAEDPTFEGSTQFDPCSASSVSVEIPIYDLGVPFVDFEAFPETASPGEDVSFTSDAMDKDQDITAYRWDFDGDGTVDATGESVTTTFEESGTYDVEHIVEDEQGYVNEKIRQVTVEGPATCSDSTEVRFTDELGNLIDQQFTYTVTNRSSGTTTDATATGGTDTYSGSFKPGVNYLFSTTVDGTAHETLVEGCPGETVRVTVEDFVDIDDDAFEDNDDIANATPVTIDETTTDLVALRDDPDYYAVDVPATTKLNATVSYDDSEAKPVVSIYDPDGRPINASAQSGGQSTTTALVPGAETFYVEVENGPSDAVSYSLTTTAEPVARTCSPTLNVEFLNEDEALLDDRTVTWALNDTYGGILASGETTDGTVSQQVTLIDRQDLPDLFGYNVDASAPGYELEVDRGSIDCSGGSPLEVTVRMDRTDLPDNDDFEGNDDRENATNLTDDQSGDAIVVAGEDDWYAFDYGDTREFEMPDNIGLRVSFNGSAGNIQATMYDEDGTVLDTGYSDTPSEFVGIEAPKAGALYYVRVNATEGATASYRFHADTRATVDIPDTVVSDRYGARLPEEENDFPVMPQLAPNRTQSLRIEQVAWLDGSGAPENRTIRLEGAVEGTPTAEMTLRNDSELLWLFGNWNVGTLGFTNVTPTATGEDVIQVVYEDGTPLKLANSGASGDDPDVRADLTIDVAADPEQTAFTDLSVTDGEVHVRVEEETGNDPVSYARVSLRDNGTVVETVTANRTAFATLSVTADLGTNLSLSTAPAGWAPNTRDITVPPEQRPGLPGPVPALPGQANPPKDLDGDGLLEDVNGDGQRNLFDALTYYNEADSDAVQNNPDAFDFDSSGGINRLFDALALWNKISG